MKANRIVTILFSFAALFLAAVFHLSGQSAASTMMDDVSLSLFSGISTQNPVQPPAKDLTKPSIEPLVPDTTDPAAAGSDTDAVVTPFFSQTFLPQSSNDTYAATQWPLDNTGHYLQPSSQTGKLISSVPDVDLDIPQAWNLYQELTPEQPEVIVAVIDTGVDHNHPDLKDHIWVNPGEIPDDGIDNDRNGYVDDIHGWDFYNKDNTVCHYEYNAALDRYMALPTDNDNHGTHVAGIIAAAADNIEGVAGVASNINVRIMSLKIHGGTDKRGSISDAIKAIQYAQAMGARICNISWGTTTDSEALRTTIAESDMLFVCAAGNSGTDNDKTPIYPASYDLDNILSVTFLNADGVLTPDSNYGSTSVDLAAPGIDIFSTLVGTYGTLQGSSMAAPHVSGIAAILFSLKDHISPQSVRALILDSVKNLPYISDQIAYSGLPSAWLALLNREQLISDTTAPTLSFETVYDQAVLLIRLTSDDGEGSGVRTIRYSIGDKSLSYFQHGTAGLSVTGHELPLNKAGVYTFYISDYAGNEAIFSYTVEDDTTPPEFRTSYTVTRNYTIILSLRALDSQSGIKQVKYLPGIHSEEDFRPASSGTPVHTSVRGYGTVKLKTPGIYTLYAVDYRGNKQIITIPLEIIKVEHITVAPTRRTLAVGDTSQLAPLLYPANSTDSIAYQSSDPTIAKVNANGLVTALAPGRVTITVTTTSGKQAKCTIYVVSS